MAQRIKTNPGTNKTNIYKAYLGVLAEDPVRVYVLSDPNNITSGMTFDPQGNTDVEEWVFTWDDNSFLANIMMDVGNLVNEREGVLESGGHCNLLDIEYIMHHGEEHAHKSLCYIDDGGSPEAVLSCVKTTLASGSFAGSGYFDWIEITLINPYPSEIPIKTN